MSVEVEVFNQTLWNWIQQYPVDERPKWDDWFLTIAFMVSRRSPCYRNKCGAIIVKNNDILAVGYNSSPKGQPNCQDLHNCYRNENNIPSGTKQELCRASGSHAESNAIAYASLNGHSTLDSTLYVYGHSKICNICKGIIANSGIKDIVYLKQDGTVERINIKEQWIINSVDQE